MTDYLRGPEDPTEARLLRLEAAISLLIANGLITEDELRQRQWELLTLEEVK